MTHLLEQDSRRSADMVAKNAVALIEVNPDALVHASTGCRFQFGDAFLRMPANRLPVANTRIPHWLSDQTQQEKEQVMSSFKEVSAVELETMLQQPGGLRLVDVRTDAEAAHGKIPQGDVIPLHLIPLRLHEMDKNTPTVFYCQMGGRSAQAAAFAAANGFAAVYNLQGGIAAWARAGGEIAA